MDTQKIYLETQKKIKDNLKEVLNYNEYLKIEKLLDININIYRRTMGEHRNRGKETLINEYFKIHEDNRNNFMIAKQKESSK